MKARTRRWIAGAAVVAAMAAAPVPPIDADRDGVDDRLEDALAEQFAPVVFHGQMETNYPANVDWILAHTSLLEFDALTPAGREVAPAIAGQASLLAHTAALEGGAAESDGARSVCKRSGFFLADVAVPDRAGQRDDPRGWTTYAHSYRNDAGGITIQYWRAYPYDQTRVLFVDWGHGGDWEGIAVHLDAALKPATIGLLGHAGIERLPARALMWEGTHPLIWSEEGGHASRKSADGLRSKAFTRQETWTGGAVTWWDGPRAAGGGVLNVGEKSHPRNGQVFIQYSGLWGSPHRLFLTSGYWGPAFNETDARCGDGRTAYSLSLGCGARSDCTPITHVAWCDRMDGTLLDLARECTAARAVP